LVPSFSRGGMISSATLPNSTIIDSLILHCQ
jgi:hypothetical protein